MPATEARGQGGRRPPRQHLCVLPPGSQARARLEATSVDRDCRPVDDSYVVTWGTLLSGSWGNNLIADTQRALPLSRHDQHAIPFGGSRLSHRVPPPRDFRAFQLAAGRSEGDAGSPPGEGTALLLRPPHAVARAALVAARCCILAGPGGPLPEPVLVAEWGGGV